MAYPQRMPNGYRDRDIASRLHNTILLYDGVPKFFSAHGGNLVMYDLPIGTLDSEKNRKTIKADDPRLDISSIEVGYMNRPPRQEDHVNLVAYVSRDPAKRGYRQGISRDNLKIRTIDNSNYIQFPEGIESQQSFLDMLTNNYPRLDEVLKETKGEFAISQAVAIQFNKIGIAIVYCRGDQIGYYDRQSQIVTIRESPLSWVYRKMVSGFEWRVRG